MAETSNIRYVMGLTPQGELAKTTDNAQAVPTANQNEYNSWFAYHDVVEDLAPKGGNLFWSVLDEIQKQGEIVHVPNQNARKGNDVMPEVIGIRGPSHGLPGNPIPGEFVNFFTVRSTAKPDTYLRSKEKASQKSVFRQRVLDLLGWRI